MQTNVELMMSSHIMDQGAKMAGEIEEKQINLGQQLVLSTFSDLTADI